MVERAPDREQQRPERERSACFGRSGGARRTRAWRRALSQPMTTAVTSIIAAASPSARRRTPSGGGQRAEQVLATLRPTAPGARRSRPRARARPARWRARRGAHGGRPAPWRASTPTIGAINASGSRNPPGSSRLRFPERASGVASVRVGAPCVDSDARLALPVASKRRRSSATPSAVAANATTRPVIVSACSTGSPPSPARRTAARDDAEEQEHAAAEQVEGEDLAQRLGLRDQTVQPEADDRGTAQAEQGARRSWCPSERCGVPASSMPSIAAIERHHRDLDRDDQRFRVRDRVGEERVRDQHTCETPTATNTSGSGQHARGAATGCAPGAHPRGPPSSRAPTSPRGSCRPGKRRPARRR